MILKSIIEYMIIKINSKVRFIWSHIYVDIKQSFDINNAKV